MVTKVVRSLFVFAAVLSIIVALSGCNAFGPFHDDNDEVVYAPAPAPAYIYVASFCRVANPADIDKVKKLILDFLPGSQAEAGCAGYELFQSEAIYDPATTTLNATSCYFLIKEVWKSREAIGFHMATSTNPAFQIFMDNVKPLLATSADGGNKFNVTVMYSSKSPTKANRTASPLNAVLWLKTASGSENKVMNELTTISGIARAKDTNFVYDLYQGLPNEVPSLNTSPTIFMADQEWKTFQSLQDAEKLLPTIANADLDPALAKPKVPFIFKCISSYVGSAYPGVRFR